MRRVQTPDAQETGTHLMGLAIPTENQGIERPREYHSDAICHCSSTGRDWHELSLEALDDELMLGCVEHDLD